MFAKEYNWCWWRQKLSANQFGRQVGYLAEWQVDYFFIGDVSNFIDIKKSSFIELTIRLLGINITF